MNRRLILIGNEGERNINFLPGVRQDIERYRAFFKSDFGGAWDDDEISPLHYGWSKGALRTYFLNQRVNQDLDYALIVFAGHGYAERNGEVYFELSPGHEVSLTDIKSYLPGQRLLMIADSCQAYLDEQTPQLLTESIRFFSEGGRVRAPRDIMRARYNAQIASMAYGAKCFASAVSEGEEANDTSKGGLYSRTLMELAQQFIDTVPGDGICTINIIHDLARVEVSLKTDQQQNPTLTLNYGYIYPPFLVL